MFSIHCNGVVPSLGLFIHKIIRGNMINTVSYLIGTFAHDIEYRAVLSIDHIGPSSVFRFLAPIHVCRQIG